MYIICFECFGSSMYFAGFKHGIPQLTSCRISCKHYKTIEKALKKLDELKCYSNRWHLGYINEYLCKEWGLIRE